MNTRVDVGLVTGIRGLACEMASGLKTGGNQRARFVRRDNGKNLKRHNIRPERDPLIEQCTVIRLHDLVATAEICRDPAGHIPKPFRHTPPLVPEAAIDGDGVAIAKVFHNHEEHVAVYFAHDQPCPQPYRLIAGAPPLNRYQLLHATPDLAVNRFDHPPHEVHLDPEEEVSNRWAIAFVRAGSFDLTLNGERRRLSPGSVFLSRPGLSFHCRHAEECPTDVCISVAFDPKAVSGSEHAWERAGWAARTSATPRLAYVDGRMVMATAGADRFEMERWAIAALMALESDSRRPDVRGPYAPRSNDVEAVIATCRTIEADPAARRSIADRARDVGLTSTRLTHHFRRYVGLSPHQYVVRWRLAMSAEFLDSGFSVSDSCYRAGFENLSHFCRTFHRAFGVRASHWASLPLGERRRKVQDLTGGRA